MSAEQDVRRGVRLALADLPDSALVLVACSGGPDSVALAVAARAERSRVGAVVVDHGLQPGSVPPLPTAYPPTGRWALAGSVAAPGGRTAGSARWPPNT